MQNRFYSVFVGNYDSAKIPKQDIAKLNALGLKAYVFSTSLGFALKVYSTMNINQANALVANLKSKGFEARVE